MTKRTIAGIGLIAICIAFAASVVLGLTRASADEGSAASATASIPAPLVEAGLDLAQQFGKVDTTQVDWAIVPKAVVESTIRSTRLDPPSDDAAEETDAAAPDAQLAVIIFHGTFCEGSVPMGVTPRDAVWMMVVADPASGRPLGFVMGGGSPPDSSEIPGLAKADL